MVNTALGYFYKMIINTSASKYCCCEVSTDKRNVFKCLKWRGEMDEYKRTHKSFQDQQVCKEIRKISNHWNNLLRMENKRRHLLFLVICN